MHLRPAFSPRYLTFLPRGDVQPLPRLPFPVSSPSLLDFNKRRESLILQARRFSVFRVSRETRENSSERTERNREREREGN